MNIRRPADCSDRSGRGLALLFALAAAVRSAAPTGDGAPDPNRTKPGPYRPLPLTGLASDKESLRVRTRTAEPKELTFGIDTKIARVFAGVVTSEGDQRAGQPRPPGQDRARRPVRPGSGPRRLRRVQRRRDRRRHHLPPKPPARRADNAKEKKRPEKK